MLHVRQQLPGNLQRIYSRLFKLQSEIHGVFLHKAVVKQNIVAQKRQIATELCQFSHSSPGILPSRRHLVCDSGQFLNSGADSDAGIQKCLISLQNPSAFYPYRSDFKNPVFRRA